MKNTTLMACALALMTTSARADFNVPVILDTKCTVQTQGIQWCIVTLSNGSQAAYRWSNEGKTILEQPAKKQEQQRNQTVKPFHYDITKGAKQ